MNAPLSFRTDLWLKNDNHLTDRFLFIWRNKSFFWCDLNLNEITICFHKIILQNRKKKIYNAFDMHGIWPWINSSSSTIIKLKKKIKSSNDLSSSIRTNCHNFFSFHIRIGQYLHCSTTIQLIVIHCVVIGIQTHYASIERTNEQANERMDECECDCARVYMCIAICMLGVIKVKNLVDSLSIR